MAKWINEEEESKEGSFLFFLPFPRFPVSPFTHFAFGFSLHRFQRFNPQ